MVKVIKGQTTSLARRFCNQLSFATIVATTTYSTSIEDQVIVFYFLDDQEIGLTPWKTTYVDDEVLSSLSLIQSTSTNAMFGHWFIEDEDHN